MNRAGECRSCSGTGLIDVLPLGCLPLANSLPRAEQLTEPEETYPLNLVFCPRCTLVQIIETVPPEKLFHDYVYLSSFSDTVLRHVQGLTERMVVSQRLGAASLVIEVASNDGYLLQYYKQAGIPVLGIEPAANIARIAEEERGIPTVCEFFGEKLAIQLRQQGLAADVIHAHNVLAHVPDLNGVVRGFKALLKETGLAVLEVPYVRDMVDQCAFDTVYHEHLCYFSLTALDRIFGRHGLMICDVERLSIHGGTLRLGVTHENRRAHGPSYAVTQMLAEEADRGMGDPGFYLGFGDRVMGLRDRLVTLLHNLKSQGARIAVYGASAKGSTLLNYFQIGRETLDYVVDRSTVKQGRYTPGTHLPIYQPAKLLEDLPEYTLLLAWNLAAEILDQQAEYRRRGGKFIIPIPDVQVV
jgi:hypothetical protein